MIFHLLYVSQRSKNVQDKDLDDIIEVSQRNNGANDISGLLIQNGDFFIQLLEGNKSKVQTTFNKISTDPRHFRVRTIYSGESPQRLFPMWAMGLVKEPTEKQMNEILPKLHTEINKHQELKLKITAALKEFNR